MIKLLSIAFVLLLMPVNKKQQDKTVTIRLTVPQANTVLKGLSKLSIEEGQETYMVILTQAQQQLQDTIPKKK